MITYVYSYSDDGTVGHGWTVGKANNIEARWKECRYELRENNCRKWDLVQAHLKAGTKPFFHILEVVQLVNGKEWEEREKYWITFGRSQGWPLTNISRGGNGIGTHREDARAKLGVTKKGKQLTPECCAKISAALVGHSVSLETRARISAAHKGKPRKKLTPEHRAKMGVANKGKKLSDVTRVRMSVAQKGKKQTSEHVAKRIATCKGRTISTTSSSR